jgi:hypothetical protein
MIVKEQSEAVTDNTMAKRKMTNNDLQNTTHKTDWAKQTPLKVSYHSLKIK